MNYAPSLSIDTYVNTCNMQSITNSRPITTNHSVINTVVPFSCKHLKNNRIIKMVTVNFIDTIPFYNWEI